MTSKSVRRGAVSLLRQSFDNITEYRRVGKADSLEGLEKLNKAIESRADSLKLFYPMLDREALVYEMNWIAEAPFIERFGRE